jgi:D-amino-acid dehydrogenase
MDAYPTITARIGANFEVVGALYVGSAGRELDEARRTLEAVHGPVELLGPEAARAAFPYLAPDLWAIRVATTLRVDGEKLRCRLLDAARASGATLHVGDAALHVRTGRVEGVRLDDEVLSSSCVVVAAGAWSARLLDPLGLSLAVSPQRGQIAHLGVQEATEHMPVVQPLGASHYLLPFGGRRVVVGATRETGSGFAFRTTAGGVSSVLVDALHVAPGLADAELLSIRVGLRPSTPDGEPMLGPVTDWPGLWIATGTGPSGLLLGPYCGQLIASSIIGHRLDEALKPFAPFRSF